MRFAFVFLAYVSLSVAPALAQDWRAVEVTGAVRVIAPGEAPRAVTAQDILPVGAIVTTGRDGRAVLSNGAARATLSANSRLTLAPSEQGFTRFVQDLGAVLFQVDRQRDPHFEVRTSLVAAVVKGTTFTVSVEPDEHRVFVAEGTVEVSALDGGDTELVTGGGIAEVERSAPDRVERPEPTAQHSAAPPAALDYAALTAGLIRNRDSDAEDDDAQPTELVLADASDPNPADAPATDDDHGATTSDDDDGANPGDDDDGGTGVDGDDDGSGTVDDDGNNGNGNDDDGDDDSNPGNGGDDDGSGAGDDDDGNNGHGNDDDGDDDGNPGNGGDDDDDDGNNGHGNDDDGDDDSNPGNGHGNGHDDDDDDDGNNGHGNDGDGEDDGNPGRGGRG